MKTIKTSGIFFVFISLLSAAFFTTDVYANVGPDGSFNYSVDIKLPPGTRGMAPKLSLSYNSNAGNGIMGKGWSLQGLPYITRDTTYPINYNGTDKYVGPGGRLVQANDPGYTGSAVIYHTEYEGFSRFEMFGGQGGNANEPSYWVETKPDGTKYYYGYNDNSQDSQVTANDHSPCIRVWALSKVEDIYGNYYLVKYVQDNGEFYPDKIIYTLNDKGGVLKYRTVEFEYEVRSDYYKINTSNTSVQTTQRLKNVIIKTGVVDVFGVSFLGDLVRRYELTYSESSNPVFSRLTGIKEYGDDDVTFKTEEFEWQISGSSIDFWTYSGLPSTGAIKDYEHYFADINGDGRTDWIQISRLYNKSYIGLGQADGSINFWTHTNTQHDCAVNNYAHYFADINGDGRSDWIQVSRTDDVGYISLGQADGSIDFWTQYGFLVGSANGYSHYFADVNGDGRADWIQASRSSNSGCIGLGQSDGNINFWTYTGLPAGATDDYNHYFVDINGDRGSDWIQVNKNYNIGHIGLKNTPSSTAIVRVKTSLSGNINITYKPAAQMTGVIDSNESIYPVITNSTPRNLVTSITTEDGRGASYETTYAYKNGKIQTGYPQNKADLFFENITQTNPDSTKLISYYNQTGKDYAGRVSKIEKKGSDDSLIEVRDYAYSSVITTIFGTKWVKLDSETSTTYEDGEVLFSNTVTNTYDDYGNITASASTSPGSGLDPVTTEITYNRDDSRWILNRPSIITKLSNGSFTVQRQVFIYSGDYNIQKKDSVDSGTILTTYIALDAYGNPQSTTDPDGVSTTISYDSDYQTFPVKITKSGGSESIDLLKSAEYDPRYGVKLWDINANNLQTNYEYDAFGRPTEVRQGSTVLKQVEYKDFGNPDLQRVITKVFDNSTEGDSAGYHYTKEYFDGLGRKYKIVKKASGKHSLEYVTHVEFDTAGRVSKKSRPYLEGIDTRYDSVYSYDNAGRISTLTLPDGMTKTYSYDNNWDKTLTVKTIYDGKSYEKIFNARGQLIKKNEPMDANIIYSYYPSGKLKTIKDTNGLTTSVSYDLLGRKTSMTDPNTGTWTYGYQGTRLKTQTDVAGNVTSYNYDTLGRISNIDYQDSTGKAYTTPDVFYTYGDGSKNDLGKVSGIMTSTDGGSTFISKTTFAYNIQGAPTVKRVEMDGRTFIFNMDYDVMNRLNSITYPDGKTITREYSDTGQLASVKWGGFPVVSYGRFETDDDGSIISYANTIHRLTGNGVRSDVDYDPVTLRPTKLVTKKDSTIHEDLNFSYFNDGKIKEILDNDLTDGVDSKQTFSYDDLNRLVSAQGASSDYIYGSLSFNYDLNGNLRSKDGNTLYYNDASHPYAVTGINGVTKYQYDANGNMTTRDGKQLVYDAKNRLVQIWNGTVKEEEYVYSSSGHRIKKIKSDGTVTYNMEGLYELNLVPGRDDHYTKYIFGMDNELAAQATEINSTLLTLNTPSVINKYYNTASLKGFFLAAYRYLNYFSTSPRILRMVYLSLLALFFIFLLCVFIYNLRNRRFGYRGMSRWVHHSAFATLFMVFSVFGMTGCELTDNLTGTAPWESLDYETGITTNNMPTRGMYFFHSDYTGNISFVTDNSGAKVNQLYYKPYGEIAMQTGTDVHRHKYGSQENDGSTGLLYYKARFYDPAVGRFISADSIVPDPVKSQALNRYMYVMGSPIDFGDPSGHSWLSKTIDAIGNAVSDATGSDKLGQVVHDIINTATLNSAYEQGGWDNVGWTLVSAGMITHTDEGGWGFTLGGNIPGTPFFAGIHYQQNGQNSGFSYYYGVGFNVNGMSGGASYSYNVNNGNTTVGLTLGYGGQYGQAGVTYSITMDSNGRVINKGLSGYGKINYQLLLPTKDNNERIERVKHYEDGDSFCFGPEGSEGGWLAIFDVIGFHATAVFHDFLVVMDIFPAHPSGDISRLQNEIATVGFLVGYAGGNILAGQNYTYNPYSQSEGWGWSY